MVSNVTFPSVAHQATNLSPTAVYSGSNLNSPSGNVNPAAVTFLCNTGGSITGVFAGPGGGDFVLDQLSGDIIWCASGAATTIATPPPGPRYTALWYGMGGVKTSLGTVLVVDYPFTGFYFCIGATSSGCTIESTFINITTWCSTTSAGSCGTQGVAMDKKLNVYLADETNNDIVKCTYASAYKTCTVIEPSSDFAGGQVIYLFLDPKGNIWVSDYSSNGYVWENGVVKYTVGNSLYGITGSTANPSKTQHIYVGINGIGIKDLNDGKFLPIASGGSGVYTLTTLLQYADWAAHLVYKTADKA